MNAESQTDNDYLTTTQAARILGISPTSVQLMVESGKLRAWKTKGGHRRIPVADVQRIAGRRRPPTPDAPPTVRVLVVEDDSALLRTYTHKIASWRMPVEVSTACDGMSALIQIERSRPDVLITDLMMKPVDGFTFIKTLRDDPTYRDMAIIAITGLDPEAIAAQGKLPTGVRVYKKPIPFEQLHGFLQAAVLKRELEG